MNDDVVRTGVDDLLELLKVNTKTALTEVAATLKVPIPVVQAWVDFLVEENIVGIEYRFTTPYIYLNRPVETKSQTITPEKELPTNIQFFKKQFAQKAKEKNIPESQIEMLWKNHVTQELELKKKYFFFEAQRRKIPKPEELWEEYKEIILFA